MFKLYYIPDAKLIAQDRSETIIKEKLGNALGYIDIINYLIIESTKEGDNIVATILDYDDYLEYKHSKPKTLTKHL